MEFDDGLYDQVLSEAQWCALAKTTDENSRTLAPLSPEDKGFGALPPGCHIHLQRQARDQILSSLRKLVQQNWRRLRTELQTYSAARAE